MFQGSMVALVTPMQEDGTIDQTAFKALIEWQVRSKTNALVISGTTGESATLDHAEQDEIIRLAVKQAAGRVPVIAGTGSNSTRAALQLTLNAKKAGAAACLVVTPYYNKPTQEGLYQHYKTLAEKAALPIILYNVPGRTACDLLPETVERLAKLPQIIGIKEATGKLERAQEIMKRCGSAFAVYSGDDATALELMKHGAKGVISVTANVAPVKMQEMCEAALQGNLKKAESLNQELMALHHKLFVEPNPIPAKWALQQMGLIPQGIRLPLLALDPRYHQELTQAMQQAGVNLEYA